MKSNPSHFYAKFRRGTLTFYIHPSDRDLPMITPSDNHKISEVYRHLTTSNYASLDCEYEEVASLLREVEESMKSLRQQLALDDERMESLIIAWRGDPYAGPTGEDYSALHETYKFVELHRPVLFTIRQLPPEIVGELLLHTLSRDDWRYYSCVHNTSLGSWSYSRVSRLWRTVALSLNQLWSKFSFNEVNAVACSADPVAAWKLWLDRSRNTPLRIFGEVACSVTVPSYEAIARLIVSQSHRWELFVWEESPYKRAPGDIETAEEDTAPCLQEILPEEIWDGAELDLPQPQLRLFHAGGTVKSNLFRLLQSAPSLTELSLALDIPPHILPSTPIMHTGIRLLDVARKAAKVIGHLTLPRLETFGITASTVSKVAAFLCRSRCTLEALYIRDPVPLGGHLSRILTTVPYLKSLSLQWTPDVVPGADHVNNHASILSKLSVVKDGRPVLLPSFQSLSIQIDESFSPRGLLRMLELRSRHSRCADNN